jgi:hypothetical protein
MGRVQTRPFRRVVEPGNLERTIDELTIEVNAFLATLVATDVLKVDEFVGPIRDRMYVVFSVVYLTEG